MNTEKKNWGRPAPSLSIEGRLQPQATELEEAVLGALLIESKAFEDVEDILIPDDFYIEANKIIYASIQGLSSKRKPIDTLTVMQELKLMGKLEEIGGPVYISHLSGIVASAGHIVFHSLIIKQKSQARQLIHITSEIQNKCFDESNDIAETIEELEKSFTELVTSNEKSDSIPMSEALKKTLDEAAEIQELKQKGISLSITTGLNSLDNEFAGGWRSPDLIIVGARPSMGKTQIALSFAKAAALSNKNVFFASIEMTSTQLVTRYLLEDDRINGYNLRTGQMTDDEWQAMDESAGKLWNMNLNISDNSNIRYLSNIKSEARRLKRKGKLDMMVIDYLQLIKTNLKFGTRDLEIGYITGELKALCKELEIPIILLAQLNRPIKGVTVKEPQLEDLRESGNIEQDADIVLFIHRPEYYDPEAKDSNGVPWKGRGKLLIAKYREGARNNFVFFYYDDRFKKIWDTPKSKSTPYIPACEPISANTNFDNETPF